MSDFRVTASAGSLRGPGPTMPHAWTAGGVSIEADFTGAHLLHLAVAGCVLNDTFREARELGLEVAGVRVTASGGFDDGWASTGIGYEVEIDGPRGAELEDLLARVDAVAEIPRTIRAGGEVGRR
ncbi:OsmC family protein [Nocardioides coralli]|uniref:OsmC family protein n=1 Tax=Nocardioides coralli TaxID=2872154 RepID=UPI001CA4507E|nr:OsmC family protein [Nocardioides coralli]QZY29833.1 OsmC family peroxiredoxin [Nocardioides coralli]